MQIHHNKSLFLQTICENEHLKVSKAQMENMNNISNKMMMRPFNWILEFSILDFRMLIWFQIYYWNIFNYIWQYIFACKFCFLVELVIVLLLCWLNYMFYNDALPGFLTFMTMWFSKFLYCHVWFHFFNFSFISFN